MKKTYTNPEFETVKVQGESFLELSFDKNTSTEIPEDGKVEDGIF